MPTPVLTASLNKTSYAKGETMTLTVTYSDPDTEQLQITVQVTDASGNTTGPVAITAVIDPLSVEVTDEAGRVWTKVSDTGAVAVFTAVA